MSSEILILIAVLIIGMLLLYFALKKQFLSQTSGQLENLVNQAFGMSAQKIAEQSHHILQGERQTIQTDMDNKQKIMENLVKQLQDEVRQRQTELQSIEKDRVQKFGELKTALDHHRRMTDELSITTKQLSTVLNNNQQRGEWGERIIEDLLKANGLVEGVHYKRQFKLGDSALKPDITLLLPNERVVPVDVKFPLSEMQKLTRAETKEAKNIHLKQFAIDVKDKIIKVAAYIDPSQNTLEYAILFVPNEMVFSFINQEFPELIDEALKRRVLIVSPFTFLIVARTVLEAYRNFMLGDKLKEIVKTVDEFIVEWDRFKSKFDKYGRTLATLKTDYDELMDTRVRQMQRKIEKINGFRSGAELKELEKPTLPTV